MEITDYLANVVKPMLTHPEDFRVEKSFDSMGVLLKVDAHPSDMGLLIGKAGETAKCIRHIVRVVGMRENARVSVKIVEPRSTA